MAGSIPATRTTPSGLARPQELGVSEVVVRGCWAGKAGSFGDDS